MRARTTYGARRRGGAAAARNDGLAAAKHDLVALLDSDTCPQPGWLEPLLAHFADPRASTSCAPRIVAAADASRVGAACARAYEARRSPLDRGPAPARVVPRGRVPFVPGAALVVRATCASTRRSTRAGRTWTSCGGRGYVRYEPPAQVAHDHRTDPRKWLAAARLLRPDRGAAGDQRHPGPRAAAARLAVDDRGVGRARGAPAADRRSRSPRPRPRCSRASSRRRLALELAGLGHAALRPRRRRRARPRLVAGGVAAALARPEGAAPASPPRSPSRTRQPAQARRRPRLRLRRLARAASAPHARAR